MSYPLRQRLGIAAVELPQYLWHLSAGDWVHVRNRLERLVAAPDGRPGVACEWRWTSDLRACHLHPWLGRRLLRRALQRWPIQWRRQTAAVAGQPKISFVIGHRGSEKVPHLRATIDTILAQTGSSVEVVIVEQSAQPVLTELPPGVLHLHTPVPSDDTPYNRAWAFNVGAGAARGDYLILHDNDLLVPAGYASEAARVLAAHDVAFLGRFVFYLDAAASRAVAAVRQAWIPSAPQRVTQNFRGGSLAIRRESFLAIGGFDEAFASWGGEDNELFDRCGALNCYPYGYLPFLHLHHTPQPGKAANRGSVDLLEQRLAIPRRDRIADLAWRNFGRRERADAAAASPQTQAVP